MRFSYVILALCIGMSTFLGVVWLPTSGLWVALVAGSHSPSEALSLSVQLLTLAFSDRSATTTAYYFLVSLLIGTNVSLLVFFWRQNRIPAAKFGTMSGIAGIVGTVLGFGCAACGGLFLTLLLSSVGASSISLLPIFDNNFIQGIGLVLLVFSTYVLYRKTREPLVCPV